MRSSLSSAFGALLLMVLLVWGVGAWWLWVPSTLTQPVAEVSIEAGTSPKEVAAAVARSGVPVNATLLYLWFRLSGQSRQIRAGSYEWSGQVSPWQILQKLVRGDESSGSVTPSASRDSTPGNFGMVWKLDKETMVYGKVSKGFKSGAINMGLLQAAAVGPETVVSNELKMRCC